MDAPRCDAAFALTAIFIELPARDQLLLRKSFTWALVKTSRPFTPLISHDSRDIRDMRTHAAGPPLASV